MINLRLKRFLKKTLAVVLVIRQGLRKTALLYKSANHAAKLLHNVSCSRTIFTDEHFILQHICHVITSFLCVTFESNTSENSCTLRATTTTLKERQFHTWGYRVSLEARERAYVCVSVCVCMVCVKRNVQ